MFKKRLLITIFILALLITLPVQAKVHEKIGERINLWTPPTEYPAGDPFHISHGWYHVPPSDVPVGIWAFELIVDGVLLKPDYVIRDVTWTDPIWILFSPVYNFPDGMDAGPHTFTGNYYAPCSFSVEIGWYSGPCPNPNAKTLVFTYAITVDFTD